MDGVSIPIFVWPETGTAGPDQNEWFELTPAGVFYKRKGRSTFVCSPLRVRSVSCDRQTRNWGRTLIWTDHNSHLHEWFVPMSMFASGGLALRRRLLSGGAIVGLDRESRRMLNVYILQMEPSQDPLPSIPNTARLAKVEYR